MIDNLVLSFKTRWKVFLLSMVAQFIVASLLHFGAQVPSVFDFLRFSSIQKQAANLVSPQSESSNIFETIKTKLEQKPNDFQLKKDSSWAPPALGPAPYQNGIGPAAVYAAGTEDILAPAEYSQANSYAAVDLDSGQVLLEGQGSQRIPIASLTKIMTAVVALDLASTEENFSVSSKAASIQPTKIGVLAGEKIKLNDLLHALLLTSANDGAQVIKEGIDQKYGEQVFIKAMNEKAKFLGLKNTRFANPQGFDDRNNYSSAEDLAVLCAYALRNYPKFSEIAQKDYQYVSATVYHRQFDLYNWNGLLGVYPGAYGIKIGNTDDAGYTTIVASQREGHKVLAVVLGAPGVIERDIWASQLLDNAFLKFGLKPAGITPEDLRVKYSTWKYWG